MPHQRSQMSKQKRALRRRLLDASLRDRDLAETICRSHIIFDDLITESGDVLIDARGRGTLQQTPPPEVNRL